ncbi:MAG TPA: CbiX/SirB N-terminal domain-containing protein, partial [Pirellulales bacterium]
SDPHTLAKLQGFAARRRRLFPVDPSKEFQESFGFVAAAEPNYRAALAAAAKSSAKRIVVQPHLLFHGRVFDEVREEVCRASALGPEREWAIAEPLGPHELLAQAVIAGIELCERDPVG